MSLGPRSAAAVVTVAALLVAGCGGSAGGADRVRVVATTAFAAEMARAVAGPAAEVDQLVPGSADPHSFGASAKDRAELDAADLIVAFGRSYEEGLPLDDVSAERFEIGEHAGNGRPGDPHVWMDPTRLAAAAPGLARALAEADPPDAAAYERRARAYAKRMGALDAELRRTLQAVPQDRRKLVTSHDSIGFFADRYGFEVVAAPFGLTPEAQASAEDLATVVDAVRREDVPVVFAQQTDDPEVMERIARETGVEVVDDLLVENPGPGGETYAAAMRHDAARIAQALAR
jgi:ABC-type Zn uptake system ZnuABC Zn-binding protein ZnuA